jgi:hypothetical protein
MVLRRLIPKAQFRKRKLKSGLANGLPSRMVLTGGRSYRSIHLAGFHLVRRCSCENDSRNHTDFSSISISGRVVPEIGDENIREWFAYSYRVIYQIENEVVTIAAIVHGKRLLEVE